MKKYILVVLVLLLAIGCIRDNPKVKIINDSGVVIDSAEIFATSKNKLLFKDIEIGQKRQGTISFDKVPEIDGSYQVILYKKGRILLQRPFGYYTNGASLNYSFRIIVEPDKIIIESK